MKSSMQRALSFFVFLLTAGSLRPSGKSRVAAAPLAGLLDYAPNCVAYGLWRLSLQKIVHFVCQTGSLYCSRLSRQSLQIVCQWTVGVDGPCAGRSTELAFRNRRPGAVSSGREQRSCCGGVEWRRCQANGPD